MGIFNIALVFGFGSGPTLGGLIYDSFGLSATFASMGILSGVGFLIVLLLLPPSKPPLVHQPSRPAVSFFRSLIRNNTVRGIITFQVIEGLTYGAVFTFLPVFMTDVRGTNLAQVGLVLSIRQLLNGLFAYPSGWLADRLNRVVLVTVGLTLLAVGVFFAPLVGGFVALLSLFAAIGIAESIALPAGNAITVNSGRALGMGSVMGLFLMANAVAVAVGSMGGAAVETSLGVSWVFYSAAGACLAGVLAFNLFMRRGSSREISPRTLDTRP